VGRCAPLCSPGWLLHMASTACHWFPLPAPCWLLRPPLQPPPSALPSRTRSTSSWTRSIPRAAPLPISCGGAGHLSKHGHPTGNVPRWKPRASGDTDTGRYGLRVNLVRSYPQSAPSSAAHSLYTRCCFLMNNFFLIKSSVHFLLKI
jgi:hypothetical protein